jgi:hypothetical protein
MNAPEAAQYAKGGVRQRNEPITFKTTLGPPLQGAPSLARLGRATGADQGPRIPGHPPTPLLKGEGSFVSFMGCRPLRND